MTEITNDVVPIPEPRRAEMASLITIANAIQVIDKDSDEEAGRIDLALQTGINWIEDFYDPHVRNATKLLNDLRAARDLDLKPLKESRLPIRQKRGRWRELEAARVAREQAEELAVERERLEDERLAHAQALADAGQPEVAEALLNQPIVEPAMKQPESAKAKGTRETTIWHVTITNENALPRAYWIPNKRLIEKTAQEHGEKTPEHIGLHLNGKWEPAVTVRRETRVTQLKG